MSVMNIVWYKIIYVRPVVVSWMNIAIHAFRTVSCWIKNVWEVVCETVIVNNVFINILNYAKFIPSKKTIIKMII